VIGTLRLLLVTDAVGGVWVYSLELARALRPLGVETVLAVMGPSPDETRRAQASGLKLVETGLPLDWMDTSPGEVNQASDAIAEIAARESADVVQTCSAALLAHSSFGRPCVAVQHSCVASWWASVKGTPLPPEFEWRRELVELGLNRAACVVAPSAAFAAETARIYDLASAVLSVHNGRSPIAPSLVAQVDFVLIAGRLWDQGKNVATLDSAAALLKVRFEAAGAVQGPNGARIGFEHLRLLGEVSPARLAGLRAARPIFASAAVYEPFGLSALEAAQAGCALVLSDIPTHRELWSDCAIFVPAGGETAFADAIQRLLDNRDEREELGRGACARAALYTADSMARAMAEIYARVAEPQVHGVMALASPA
jgi:glycosyltransferase involved in cell wall biosynthesis